MNKKKQKDHSGENQMDTDALGVAPEETVNTQADETQTEPAADETVDQIAELQAQVDDLKDKYLRQVAEFDNYRKRTMKEKAELILNGSEKSILSLLPVVDDMERAVKTMQNSTDVEAIRQGIDLIYNKFLSILASQHGVKPIEATGQALDTDFHEAIAVIPSPNEDGKGKILDCVQTGYTMNDKVIRHAKVVVGE